MADLSKILAGLALPLDVLREAVADIAVRNPDLAEPCRIILEQLDALRNAPDLRERAYAEIMELIAAIQAGHGEIDPDDPHTDA